MFSTKITLIFVLIFLIIFGTYFNYYKHRTKDLYTTPVSIPDQSFGSILLKDKEFGVYIADTDYLRNKGLSETSSLASNYGMLFVFPEDDLYGFWMKDMFFPIDIIWIDKNLVIVHIETNVLPETYPKVFFPSVPARYVLELSAGQSDFLKLKIGDSIKILKKY